MIVTDSVQAYREASRPQPDPLPAEMQARGQWDGMLFDACSGDRGGEG